jgi:hypothetical protein
MTDAPDGILDKTGPAHLLTMPDLPVTLRSNTII